MYKLRLITALFALVSFTWAHAEPSFSGYFNVEHFDAEGKDAKYDMHHFNIMVGHEIGKFSLFAELEFEHAPATEDGIGNITAERAYGQYSHNRHLNVRAGVMLNDTLYQENHYPSIVYNISRPQMVKKIISGSSEGIRVFGEIGGGFDYAVEDGQEPGVAGVPAENKNHKTYSLGYSFNLGEVTGRVSARQAVYHKPNAAAEADETATSYDLNLKWNSLGLWFESGAASSDETIKLTDKEGTYAILSYDLELEDKGTLIPYYMYDSFKDKVTDTDATVRTGLGVAYRPEPQITLKLEHLSTDDGTDTTAQWAAAFVYFYN
ncbi:MAG: hypothetical protein A2Z20_10230 [Bdellovibrionales bacterium RBG_16_40_8]|nr:MAG: hypothetical protein A2Z20_10230 [Bdellovibrionales bacterium RBG_16_40_8]